MSCAEYWIAGSKTLQNTSGTNDAWTAENAAFRQRKAAFLAEMILPGAQRPRVISKKKGGMKNENILYYVFYRGNIKNVR